MTSPIQTVRSLVPFFAVSFLFSWLIWIPLALAGNGLLPFAKDLPMAVGAPLGMLGAFGPLVGALVAIRRSSGKGAIGPYLRGFLDFRLGLKAYLLPLALLGGPTALAWYAPELWGEARLPMLVPSVWIFPVYLLAMILLGGGQEEFGWRGYALPRLEAALGLWRANLLLGAVWGIWHLPLWFIPQASQPYMNFGGFVLLTIGYSCLFSWIRQLAGNRPFAGLYVHGVANAFIPFLPPIIMKHDVPQPRYWIWVGLTLVVGVVVMALRRPAEK